MTDLDTMLARVSVLVDFAAAEGQGAPGDATLVESLRAEVERVRAKEREACASLVENLAEEWDELRMGPETIAARVRARGAE